MKELSKEKLAQLLKALGDTNRIIIIATLSQEEKCVCELIDEINLSQPALSHHLKILKQAELIKDKRDGKWIFYSVNYEEYKDVLDLVNSRLGSKVENYTTEQRTEPKIKCEM